MSRMAGRRESGAERARQRRARRSNSGAVSMRSCAEYNEVFAFYLSYVRLLFVIGKVEFRFVFAMGRGFALCSPAAVYPKSGQVWRGGHGGGVCQAFLRNQNF
jgi:hypothetical protein